MLRNLRTWWDEVRLDVAYAARTVLRAPGFALAALSLGLAVGATTAVYSTADWLLDRSPEGVVAPERLVGLWLTERGRESTVRYGFSLPQYDELGAVQDVFLDLSAYAKVVRFASNGARTDEVVQQFVTGSYFPLLGVRPFLGRLITDSDDVPGGQPLAVLSHAFWRSHFGGDPDVVGRPIRFGSDFGRIIGVLPADFDDYSLDWNGPTQVWLPMQSATELAGMAGMLTMNQTFFRIMGRLRPGIGAEAAQERAQTWLGSLPPVETSVFEPNAIMLEPEREMRVARRGAAQAFLGALLVVCVLVLLAASANVANFLLGRASVRRKEMALRAAVGASRGRLVRQLVTESSLLAASAAGLAALLGGWVGSLLAPLPQVYLGLPDRTAPLTTAGAMDERMVTLAVGGAFIASLLLGALPALGSFHDPASSLKRSKQGWSWRRLRPTGRQSVLVLQVGLAVVLAITATLFGRSFYRAAQVDVELRDPPSVALARLVPVGLEPGAFEPFSRALIDRLSSTRGVSSVSFSSNLPYAGGQTTVRLPEGPGPRLEVGAATVGPRFFETLGIGLRRGREFTALDSGEGRVIINNELADRLWPEINPVGQRLTVGSDEAEVVGVVSRERCRELLGPPTPCVWLPMTLSGGLWRTISIRTTGPAVDFMPTLRQAVATLNPNVAIVQEQSLEEFLARFTRAERAAAIGSAALALFGVALLAIGCASVFTAMVRDSVREVAVRIAVGATATRLVARLAGQGSLVLGAGVVLGIGAAALVAPGLSDQLVNVSTTDFTSYAAAAALILAVGMTAVTHAGLRAARTDPAEHLRGE